MRLVVIEPNEDLFILNDAKDTIIGYLQEVTLPQQLTEISPYAFADNNLTNVSLPNNLQEIGAYAFYKNKLETVVLPENVKIIGA